MAHYLRLKFDIIEEYPYPYEGWHIHPATRAISLGDMMQSPAVRELVERTPGIPQKRFESAIQTKAADVYVLSFSSEIYGSLKRSRSTSAILPLCIPQIGDAEFAAHSYEKLREMNTAIRITPAQWAFLQDEYESAGYLDADLLTADLNRLFAKLAGKLVIVLQLNSKIGGDQWILETFERINEIVLPVAQAHGCKIINMSDFVKSIDDLVAPDDGGVHYRRDVYQALAARIEDIYVSYRNAGLHKVA